MLTEVASGVWVRQSELFQSNAVVLRGEHGVLLVDPGIDGDDLAELADDIAGLGESVAAGFSTHPHWDHLLWHASFGEVPGTARRSARASHARDSTMPGRRRPGSPTFRWILSARLRRPR